MQLFHSVLETIKAETPTHSSFVKDRGCVSEAWLKYEFSLKDDRSRKVRLAVLCFHFREWCSSVEKRRSY